MSIPLTADQTLPFTPPALAALWDSAPPTDPRPGERPVFFLRVPTWEDRDMVGIRLFRMNVREVTPNQIQALLINELFEVMEDEDKADDAARFIEGFWQRQAMFQLDMSVWNEQEAQRLSDIREHPGLENDYPQMPLPPERTTIRERARASMLTTFVQDNSQALRDKLADQQGYDKRYKAVIARLQVAGWTGLETPATMHENMLTSGAIEALRSEIHELDPTGNAWTQLVVEIESFWDLSPSAEKNSSSPPGSTSPPSGSTSQSTGSGSTDGSSTIPTGEASPGKSSSGSIPDASSPTTTATRSPSSEGSGERKRKHGQTGKR